MKLYKIEISGTDLKIRQALKEACNDCLISIEPSSKLDTECSSIATIEAHDDYDFGHMMIMTGKELQRIS